MPPDEIQPPRQRWSPQGSLTFLIHGARIIHQNMVGVPASRTLMLSGRRHFRGCSSTDAPSSAEVTDINMRPMHKSH
jgi:hypothetical protein